MDAAEYKHVVLGLIFLKYLSDAFDEYHTELVTQVDEGADPEDRDEYAAVGLYWVPKDARWAGLKNKATDPAIGKLVDDAMLALERENPIPARRAAEGIRAAVAGQGAARPADHRPLEPEGGRENSRGAGRARAGLRVLSWSGSRAPWPRAKAPAR